ncbi:phytanoyl-CoA dioxygenase family protein [Aquariibacter albus]|uniref:Phytanoyl-CoA dioxygenase family protein n=1 Tax=Aquariibacter albus TaxID=2759899 RepID=A0A839HUA2_9BURK|nr:phytanoyl-CoA dioxygenase family protein [Aquariibacter albus]MBB1163330.1 phytanoyl-CoA dioxygenase family protein [Aquariibacter albus]
MRPVFQDSELQARFERDGYVVVPGLDAEGVARLTAQIEAVPGRLNMAFEPTLFHTDPVHKQAMHALVLQALGPVAERYLLDYRPLVGNAIFKHPARPDAPGTVGIHQDWTMTDETRFVAVNLWTALVETEVHNGAMHMLRGGHRLPVALRGTNLPFAIDPALYEAPGALTPVPMRAGEVLIYDLRCPHASPPNRSDKVRPAAGLGCLPREAPALHCMYDAAQREMRVYESGTEFYTHFSHLRPTLPPGTRLLQVIPEHTPPRLPVALQQALIAAQALDAAQPPKVRV